MQPSFFIRILSFVWPIILKKYKSAENPVLEITLYRNKMLLNSENANYSFGSLHAVMKKALKIARKEYKPSFNKILLLGYGAGSASHIIHKKYNLLAEIIAVEIDPQVIEIAEKWFPQKNVRIFQSDAFDFILRNSQKFDIIICDVFKDLKSPDFVLGNSFYESVAKSLNPNAVFIQNLILDHTAALGHFKAFGQHFKEITLVNPIEMNWLFFGKRK
jgi:spermidine synthase